MSEPTIKTDASPLSLSLSERLTLIDKLNNLPLSQFLELEGALNVPSGIMSAVQNPQGIRSNELLRWVEGPTGRGLRVLLDIIETRFNIVILQRQSQKQKTFDPTLNESTPNSEELTLTLSGNIEEIDAEKLKTLLIAFQEASGDGSIHINSMKAGSIKLKLSGTTEGLARLRELAETGELAKIIGIPIESVQLSNRSKTSEGLNLSYADLSGTELSYANLSGANLSGANLNYSNLSYANLIGANLSRANLSHASFFEANLSGANLSRANLSHASLNDANFIDANLMGAYLMGAYLMGAYLSKATLSDADLSDATLIDADLRRADLRRATLIDADLRRADLRRANLSRAVMTGSQGLSKKQKLDFTRRGAIFKDTPDDRSPIFSRPKSS